MFDDFLSTDDLNFNPLVDEERLSNGRRSFNLILQLERIACLGKDPEESGNNDVQYLLD